MSKSDVLSARMDLRVAPQILADLDMEISRLRMTDQMFGNRRPRHAAIVMAAIKEFLTLPELKRDQAYSQWFAELSGESPPTIVMQAPVAGKQLGN